MNRIKIMIILLLTVIIVTGCDRNEYESPQFNSREKWISRNPDIYFVSLESIEYNGEGLFVGKLNLGNECIDIGVVFDYNDCHRHGVYFYPLTVIHNGIKSESERLFCGSYEFDEDKLIVTIENDKVDLFNSEVKTITFTKEIIEPKSDPYIAVWERICKEKIDEVYDEFIEQVKS